MARKAGSKAVPFLLLSLIIPIYVHLGPISLTPYKIALIVLFFPAISGWLSGRAGAIQGPDLWLLGFPIWVLISYVILHQSPTIIEPVGVIFLETFVAYLVARVYIRTADDFLHFARWFCGIVAFLGVLAAIESFTGVNLLTTAFGAVFDVVREKPLWPRWGLKRAAVSFDHSIIYGVFCSLGFSLAIYVLGFRRDGGWGRKIWPFIVAGATFFSLSMGAYLSVIAQLGLTAWSRIMRPVPGKWMILVLGVVGVFVFLELATNRGAVRLFLNYLTFNAQTAYIRLDIWSYGIANVYEHPIFGMGMNSHNWSRPEWLPVSTDHMWLTLAIRHGFVGLGILIIGYALIFWKLARLKITDPRLNAYRQATLFTITAVVVSTLTVHLWEAPFVMFNFFFGAIMWMLDGTVTEEASDFAAGGGNQKGRRRFKESKSRRRADDATLSRRQEMYGRYDADQPENGPPSDTRPNTGSDGTRSARSTRTRETPPRRR